MAAFRSTTREYAFLSQINTLQVKEAPPSTIFEVSFPLPILRAVLIKDVFDFT
jgi:hypothetical protein